MQKCIQSGFHIVPLALSSTSSLLDAGLARSYVRGNLRSGGISLLVRGYPTWEREAPVFFCDEIESADRTLQKHRLVSWPAATL